MSTKKTTLFMESTEVPAERTVGEITGCLVRAGATSIHTEYDAGKIVGLAWTQQIGPALLNFRMPARVEPVYKLLLNRASGFVGNERGERIRAQAERVAWRQLLRWIQAQLAMIETGMVKSHEVFMPYIMQRDGMTMFEYFESKQLALPAPEGEK